MREAQNEFALEKAREKERFIVLIVLIASQNEISFQNICPLEKTCFLETYNLSQIFSLLSVIGRLQVSNYTITSKVQVKLNAYRIDYTFTYKLQLKKLFKWPIPDLFFVFLNKHWNFYNK